MRFVLVGYVVWLLAASLIAFVTFGWDKYRAATGGWRVPEKTLHLLALAGGWPGALLGQRLFRHKTQKVGFRLVLWGAIALHLGLVGLAAYWWRGGD